MLDWSQMFSDGMSARIVEGYQFPLGDVFNGEILKDGKVLFKTKPRKTKDECRVDMVDFLRIEIAEKNADIHHMNDLKDKMEDADEQVR